MSFDIGDKVVTTEHLTLIVGRVAILKGSVGIIVSDCNGEPPVAGIDYRVTFPNFSNIGVSSVEIRRVSVLKQLAEIPE